MESNEDICQFEYEEDGIVWRCPHKHHGNITRCKNLCNSHFQLLVADNKKRINKDIDIFENTDVLSATKSYLSYLVNESGEKYSIYKSKKELNKVETEIPQSL